MAADPAELRSHRVTRLTILDFGAFEVRPDASGPILRRIGIPGFLLETDRGACILFDTGMDPAYASDPLGCEARDGLSSFGSLVDFSAGQTAAGQLAVLGLTPPDITHVILSHGHIDHVGSLTLFPHRPIILTRIERAEPRPIYFGQVRPLDWPDANYHRIQRETVLCHGLLLIPTPGHVPGHLSALITIDGQSVILAADAINRASEPGEGFHDAMDPATAATSAARLLELQRLHDATMIYGHDPDQWPTLPKAPRPLLA